MDRSNDVVAALLAMGEGELARVVAAAAAQRPGLEAVHAAALAAAGSLPRDPVDPAFPTPPPRPAPGGRAPGPDLPMTGHPDVLDGELVADPDDPAAPLDPLDAVAGRIAAAAGAAELDAGSPAGRADAAQWAQRQRAGRERLARIRAETRRDAPS